MPVTVRPDFVASWTDSVLVRNFFFHLRTVSEDTLFSDSMHTLGQRWVMVGPLALGKQRWPNVRPTSGNGWSITVGYTTLAHCWAYVHLRHSHSIANVDWWHNIGPTLSQCCKMFPYFTETMTLAQCVSIAIFLNIYLKDFLVNNIYIHKTLKHLICIIEL